MPSLRDRLQLFGTVHRRTTLQTKPALKKEKVNPKKVSSRFVLELKEFESFITYLIKEQLNEEENAKYEGKFSFGEET